MQTHFLHAVHFFPIFFTIHVGIASYFLCFFWYLRKGPTRVKFGTRTQAAI